LGAVRPVAKVSQNGDSGTQAPTVQSSSDFEASVEIALETEPSARWRMSSGNIETKVIELVKSHWEGANVRNVRINNSFDQFVRGSLYVVSIHDADNRERENYVYVVGRQLRLFTDLNDLAMGVGEISNEGHSASIEDSGGSARMARG